MPDPSKVFKIARLQRTLVIVPQGATMNFQYTDVHLESNELFRIIDEPELDNVLVDLGAVTYIDSIIISSLLRVLTKSRQSGGKGVFCCANDEVKEVLSCIQIGITNHVLQDQSCVIGCNFTILTDITQLK